MNECKCGRPTRDGAYLCETCTDQLAQALGDVPWLDEQLDITLTRQKGVDYRAVGGSKGGQKAAERPSPVTWAASDARSNLKDLLVLWVRQCIDDNVRNQSPHDGIPAETLPAMSRFLLWRVDGLAFMDYGPDAVEEITTAVKVCHRLIDRPADRQYLGACREDDCDGRLYGRPGSTLARCETCHTTVNAEDIRGKMLAELDDRLCTAAEIAHLSTYLGLQATREQVRKHVEYLARKDRIARHAAFSDKAVYRFGEVYDELIKRDYQKAGS